MNGVGMYQNYMTSLMGQINNCNGKKADTEKKCRSTSSFGRPEAMYERTSTDEDIKRVREKQQANHGCYNREETEDKKTKTSSLENFTISQKKEVQLSEKAQDLLERLKEKYSNMDFFVADFSTDEEAQQYLSQGTKEYSVVIDPETLEKMAEDEEAFQKYDSILSNAGNTFEQVREQLGEDAGKVANLGMNIDKDGKVTLFAELDKQSVKMVETQKKMREEKAVEKKAQKEKEEKEEKEAEDERMTFRVTGTNMEELVKAIKEAVWE